jgi:hypothetical protein
MRENSFSRGAGKNPPPFIYVKGRNDAKLFSTAFFMGGARDGSPHPNTIVQEGIHEQEDA